MIKTASGRVLILLFTLSFVFSAVRGYGLAHPLSSTDIWQFILEIILSICIFAWYYYDSSEIGFQRRKWFNILMIFGSIIAVPIYLFKTREGQRGRAFARLAGYILLLMLISVAGALAGVFAT